jgi:hypothetical protein
MVAKPGDVEIGFRGAEDSGKLSFWAFLFVIPNSPPGTSVTCRDQTMADVKRGNDTVKILATSEISGTETLPVEVVSFSDVHTDGKTWYGVRGFVAKGEICGSLEFYADSPVSADDPQVKDAFATCRLDLDYAPRFMDVFNYASILYKSEMYKAAGPIYEEALGKLGAETGMDQVTWRRVTTDQAGMSYGISGDDAKARAIFEAGIAKDPDYPLYYYNLACADADENKLPDAEIHLREAFDRKANVIPGESLPDPTKDDSFLAHKDDKEFWAFVKTLH